MQKADLISTARKHIAEALELIDIASTIEPKRGYWYDKGSMSCRCSNCGCKSINEFSFCPNCGADMRAHPKGRQACGTCKWYDGEYCDNSDVKSKYGKAFEPYSKSCVGWEPIRNEAD